MWFVFGAPLAVVVAGIATVWLAVSRPDPVVLDHPAGAGRDAPALAARNHAATPAVPAASEARR